MAPTLQRGLFITFEGGEGAGKTTLIDKIARQLLSEGYQVIKTREPGNTRIGEQIRSMLLDHGSGHPLSYYAELCLYLASRAQHIDEVITPALNEHKMILCDRYNDSTIAYQGAARNLGAEDVKKVCDFICHNVQPQLTFYLDIDPALGLSRARKGQPEKAGARGYDRIESESLAFHEKVRNAYLAIHAKEPNRFILLDATQTPQKIFEEAIQIIYRS